MSAARVLHVDDEPDIREVVRLSLELDPELTVHSCASGAEAIAAIRAWVPDIVLLDVMMPNMDGPTTLAELRLNRASADIPVVFMTARVQTREIDRFKALGAAGVLAKPFDPTTLAGTVRAFIVPKPPAFAALREEFLGRAREYANQLAGCMEALAAGADRADELENVRQIAHRLAGAAGIFGYRLVSADASALEEILIANGADPEIKVAAGALLARIAAMLEDRQEVPLGTGGVEALANPTPAATH